MPRKTVTVTAPGSLLARVLELCDGRTAWKEVAAELARTWSHEAVDPFLSELSTQGVLVEAGEVLARWSDIGQLPAAFPVVATREERPSLHRVAQDRLLPGAGAWSSGVASSAHAFAALLKQRGTFRTFDDNPLDASVLASILWAAHGVSRAGCGGAVEWHRTVASGGNMHSARWFVAVLRDLPADPGVGSAHPMAPGFYEALFHQEGGVSFAAVEGDPRTAWLLLQDPRVMCFASALVLPVYDVALPARKYGNLATRFANVEAGQSLQNAQLMAGALGAASMVCGHTISPAVLKALAHGLRGTGRPHWVTMPALLVGARPDAQQVRQQESDGWIEVGEVHGAWRCDQEKAAPRCRSYSFSAGPIPVGDAQVHAGGRAVDPRVAVLKAEAEAWERAGWGSPGKLEHAAISGVRHALDPRTVVAYAPGQYSRPGFPCLPFSARRKYFWKDGVEAGSGKAVALPAEFIYALGALPAAARAAALTNTSTSGVAAWRDSEGALCRATLELLERDAFLRAWLGRRPLPRLVRSGLPLPMAQRIGALEADGYRVAISAIGGSLVPAFSVFLQGHVKPFTAVTAAASFDAEAALEKALDEAEGRAAQAHLFPAQPLRTRREAQGMAGIESYYQTLKFYRDADFYAAGPECVAFADVAAACARDWDGLKGRLAGLGLALHAFDLTPAGASVNQGRVPLYVVRAVVPGLLPIWFHHGMQPAGLAAYQQACSIRAAGRGDRRDDFIHPFV